MKLPRNLLIIQVLAAALLLGCQNNPTSNPTPSAQQTTPNHPPSSPTETTPKPPDTSEPAAHTKSTNAGVNYAAQFQRTADLIAKQDFDAAQAVIVELEGQIAKVSPGESLLLSGLRDKFEEQQQLFEDQRRERLLTEAKQGIVDGKLDAAAAAVETLLASAPTTEQSELAGKLQSQIDRQRTLQQRLKAGLELLASSDRARAKEAQEILWDEQEVALPLLLDALQSDDAVLVTNTLELLRKFNQPNRTLPAMLAILGREQQVAAWPVTIKELQKIQQPGCGAPLLQLALAAPTPERAAPLLKALAGIVDPPPETVVNLLPTIYEDSPALESALWAAFRAITVNHQQDILTRRGIDLELTPQQDQQLNGLTGRLQAIIASADKQPDRAEVAWAAERLAIALRLTSPQAFSGVKVLRASAESPEGPAAAVFDKVWNSTDLKSMWRHPSKRLTTIVLDVGAERTVTGVRIWNYNEPNGTHRGWKDLEIYVSSDSSPTVPIAVGIVPQAPGAANTPDYGTVLPVPFARGRFVKLQFLSAWRDDGIAGLAELEVLGY